MSSFRKAIADICGIGEPAVLRNLPGNLVLDRIGEGFPKTNLKSMIICTARSGSSLLSVALDAYGFDFQEYLNTGSHLRKVIETQGVTTMSELAPHFADYATVDGRMSIKTPADGLPYMFAMGEFPKNLDQWRFVYLRRENLVRQAISGAIAVKTGQWTKVMAQKGEVTDDDYSFDQILKIAGGYAQGNRSAERFIGLLGLPTYNVVYEEFLQDQKRILAEIAAFLGVNVDDYPEAANHEPWIERQATGINDVWEQRFREDLKRQLGEVELAEVV